jgi:hypothetical protein
METSSRDARWSCPCARARNRSRRGSCPSPSCEGSIVSKDGSQLAVVVRTGYDVNTARVDASAEVSRKKEREEDVLPETSFWTHTMWPSGED